MRGMSNPRHAGLDPYEVRRAYYRNGADYKAAAKELGVTDTTVRYHVLRLNAETPLTYGEGEEPDQAAMVAYVRWMLKKVGIRARPSPPAPPSMHPQEGDGE
jgi:hypothetical protein